MERQLEKKIKTGVTVKIDKNGKKVITGLIKNWNNLAESIYNNEKNYMVLVGKKNNVIVIDLDNKGEFFKALEWFQKHFGKEFDTFTTGTINKGFHVFFIYTSKIKNMAIHNDGMELDILTDGKGVLQGEGYPVVCDKDIRELTDAEIDIINSLKKNKQKDKQKDIDSLNKKYGFPSGTQWDITTDKNGYKIIPDTNMCMVEKGKSHSTAKHSCVLCDDKGKSATYHCFSHGTVACSRAEIELLFSGLKITIDTKENTLFESLSQTLREYASTKGYLHMKNTGDVYKKVKCYAYVKYSNAMDFINEVFLDNKEFSSNINNIDNLIKYLKKIDGSQFGFIKYNNDYIGFKNGYLNKITCEFTENPEECDFIVKKYIDQDFVYSKETPLMDSVLDYQFTEEVRDFIYICLGRTFGIRDDWQFMPYLLGEPGCGKSLILEILTECFDSYGSIDSSFESKYGLSYLHDKDIIISDDLPKDISKIFPQQTFQSVVSGGKISTAVKNGDALQIQWKTPMIWAGNWFPGYFDKGQISRRVMTINFEKNVYNPDTTLCERIINTELPAFIYKCITMYNDFYDKYKEKSIWNVCPKYFKEQQEELKRERNPLFRFLEDNTQYKKDSMLLISDIREQFSAWLKKNVSKLDNGTFGQVNKEYKIEEMNICNMCSKKAMKGCCILGNNKTRSKKKVVLNIEYNFI